MVHHRGILSEYKDLNGFNFFLTDLEIRSDGFYEVIFVFRNTSVSLNDRDKFKNDDNFLFLGELRIYLLAYLVDDGEVAVLAGDRFFIFIKETEIDIYTGYAQMFFEKDFDLVTFLMRNIIFFGNNGKQF